MFELPWPSMKMSPNQKRKSHWSTYAPIIKKYRADCCLLAKNKKPDHFDLTVTFYPPDNRRRDDDNIIGAFKAGRDGLADAWGVDDYEFNFTYKFAAPVKGGKVVVE